MDRKKSRRERFLDLRKEEGGRLEALTQLTDMVKLEPNAAAYALAEAHAFRGTVFRPSPRSRYHVPLYHLDFWQAPQELEKHLLRSLQVPPRGKEEILRKQIASSAGLLWLGLLNLKAQIMAGGNGESRRELWVPESESVQSFLLRSETHIKKRLAMLKKTNLRGGEDGAL